MPLNCMTALREGISTPCQKQNKKKTKNKQLYLNQII